MATHYIARGEPSNIAATTTTTVSYAASAAGSASYDVTVAAGGAPVLFSVFKTGTTNPGNIVVLPGTTKVIAPLSPPGLPTNLTLYTTTTASTSVVYVTPIVSLLG